jgi:cytochrome c oxidase cbb3-type subunit 3/ubiquinol-cytochrome c reductase cytochrome c subunit
MKRRSFRSATLLIAVAWVPTFAGCDSLPGRPKGGNETAPPADFGLLYQNHCAGCHGADGRFGPAPILHDPLYLSLIPADRFRAVVEKGVPGTAMTPFSQSHGGALSGAQIDALTRGAMEHWSDATVTGGETPPRYAGPLGDPVRGAGVYAAACANCHGADGRGGEKGHDIVDPTYLALVSDQALRTAVIVGRPDLGMPDWRGEHGTPLTADQVSDVVAWMASHRVPVVGRPAFGTPGG